MIEVLGRDRELAEAVRVLTGSGDATAVVVEGAPGIGKTVFLDAVLDAARAAGAVVLEARPTEAEARIGLLGLHDLLDPLGTEVLRTLPEPQRERIEIALGRAKDEAAAAPDEGVLAMGLRNVIRAVASRNPVVVAIDDLQWLDASTGALLESSLRRLHGDAVRLIATRRITDSRTDRLDLGRVYRDRLLTIRLEGLTLGALHRLLAERLGRSLPRPVLIRLHEATGGNPLHALELARALPNRVGPADALDAAMAAGLESLLGRRLGRLPQTALDVVAVVAMTTRPDLETIARTLERPREEVERAGEAAVGSGLLTEASWGLALVHPLIGHATTSLLSPARRRELHRRLAAIVAEPDRAAVHLALSTTRPDERVAAALERAATRGLAVGATVEAVDLLDRAVRLTPPVEEAARLRRRLALCRALLLAGDTGGAFGLIREIDIDSIPEPSVRADAILLLGVIQRYRGDHAAAIERHEHALRWVTDRAQRARLHLRLAWLIELDIPRAYEHVKAGLELLDPGADPVQRAFARLLRARHELALGLRADHAAIAEGQALQARASSRDWDVSIIPVDWALLMNDWATARTRLAEAMQAAEDSGDETSLGHLLRRQVEVETWSGDLPAAAKLVEAALERAEAAQQTMAIASARARRALISAMLGEHDRAEVDGQAALDLALRHENANIACYALTALAMAARLRDDFARVDELSTRASALLDATGDLDQGSHRIAVDHLDALLALGALDRARDLVARLEKRAALGPRPTWAGVADRGRAGIALAEGRLQAAAEHARRAVEIHGDERVPLETVRSLLVAADIDRRMGRRRAATTDLDRALAVAERIGATGWAARVRQSVEPLSRDRSEVDALSPSEVRIADLAVAGLRNREIATRLAISEKTVEAALARAYGKLGIRSRAQLATALARAEGREKTSTR